MEDDFVLKVLWSAQQGNMEYPFESQEIRAKRVPKYSYSYEERHAWYENTLGVRV